MAMLRYSIDRRIDASLLVQGGYSFVDGEAESGCAKVWRAEMIGLEIVPGHLDVVAFGCVFYLGSHSTVSQSAAMVHKGSAYGIGLAICNET